MKECNVCGRNVPDAKLLGHLRFSHNLSREAARYIQGEDFPDP